MAQFNFDANAVPERQSFEPLPAGEYQATYVSDEKKRSVKSGSDYLNVQFQVKTASGGERNVWTIFNLWHPKDQTRGIAEQQFAELIRALGITSAIKGTEKLIGKRCIVRLGIEAASGNYEAKNKVLGYKPLAGSSATSPRPAAAPAKVPAKAPAKNAEPDYEAVGPFRGLSESEEATRASVSAEDALGGTLFESMIAAGMNATDAIAKLREIKSKLGIASITAGMSDDASDATQAALGGFAERMEKQAAARAAHWAGREEEVDPDALPF